MSLKNDIRKLHAKGKSYNEIARLLQCSKGTISYHLNKNVHRKTVLRHKKWRSQNPLKTKISRFRSASSTSRFCTDYLPRDSRDRGIYNKLRAYNKHITWKDVKNKFGKHPVCYLTGTPIDLNKASTYALDHIMPKSRGGLNTLENMGLTTKKANQAKHDMMLDEFLDLCETILRYHGRL